MRIPVPAALLAAIVAGRAPAAGALARGPYLQRPGDSTIAVHWETIAPSVGSVEYRLDRPPAQTGPTIRTEAAPAAGDAGGWQRTDEPGPGTSHRIALSNLAPGAVYAYRVLADGEPLSANLRFRAPRCPDDSTVAFGVIGDTTGGTIPSALAADLSAEGVDFVLHAGDVNYPDGRLEDYDVNFFVPFAPLLATTPVLPILGDHDVRTSGGAPFFEVFDLPPNGATPEPRFYSFRQGNAEFFCLDVESSAYGEDSDQYRWLERRLKSSTAAWKFVTVFEPPFTSENSNVVERLVLSPLFERYGVDVVFSGHEHLYERTRPISLWGPPGTPVVYVVEGGGGSVLSTADPESFSAFLASVFGYVTVRISGDTLVLEAHDATGAVIDETAMVKPSVPPADGRSCGPAPFSLRVDSGQRLSGGPPRP